MVSKSLDRNINVSRASINILIYKGCCVNDTRYITDLDQFVFSFTVIDVFHRWSLTFNPTQAMKRLYSQRLFQGGTGLYGIIIMLGTAGTVRGDNNCDDEWNVYDAKQGKTKVIQQQAIKLWVIQCVKLKCWKLEVWTSSGRSFQGVEALTAEALSPLVFRVRG